jgi:hypothetical protein
MTEAVGILDRRNSSTVQVKNDGGLGFLVIVKKNECHSSIFPVAAD